MYKAQKMYNLLYIWYR